MAGKPHVRIDFTLVKSTPIAHAGAGHLDKREYDALCVLLASLDPLQVQELLGDYELAHFALTGAEKIRDQLQRPELTHEVSKISPGQWQTLND